MSFDERVQNLINSLDQGAGLALMRSFLFCVFAAVVFGVFAWSQFRGLRDPEAMEACQLARSLARGDGFAAQCVRPAELKGTATDRDRGAIRDTRHAPLYPALLSLAFRLVPSSHAASTGASCMATERFVVLPFGILFSAATGVLVLLCGRRLFGARTGFYAMLIYFLSEGVLSAGISGTAQPLAAFLCTASIYTAIVAVANVVDERPAWTWLLPLAISAVLSGLGFLTAYSLGLLVPALAIYVARDGSNWTLSRAALYVAIVALVTAPWVYRNVKISGEPLGTAPRAALAETVIYPGNMYDRTLRSDPTSFKSVQAVKLKIKERTLALASKPVQALGGTLMACFFLLSFFSRFGQEQADRFRWFFGAGLIPLLACSSAGTAAAAAGTLHACLPVILLYATGFLLVTIERTEFLDAPTQNLILWAAVAFTALPAALKLTGPGATIPYPPYYPPFIQEVCRHLGPTETLATDIPWATAWYGDRRSLVLPATQADLLEIHTNRMALGGVYLTTVTGTQPYVGTLLDGSDKDWLPIIRGEIPEGFPFRIGFRLPPGRIDQIFLTNRSGGLTVPGAPVPH